MARKRDEVYLAAETYISPQLFPEMRPIGPLKTKSGWIWVKRIFWAIVWVAVLGFGGLYWYSTMPSAKELVVAEGNRISKASKKCFFAPKSKECRYLKEEGISQRLSK